MNKNFFDSPREVKWCPGCGNYSILKIMQKTLFSLGLSNNNIVFISGIGCSGRFSYYMNTYGFHTLHGRSPAIASGLKIARPDLKIWIVIGDGDGFSIGLGHLLHMVRRNLDINILFINNQVYGLTKGQYSPTSQKKTITISSPFGSIEDPINPVSLILSLKCKFVARVLDTDFKNMSLIINKAMIHNGTSFIEVLQNCNIYNDKVYHHLSDKKNKDNKVLYLHEGKILTFGLNNQFGICISESYNLKIFNRENNCKLSPIIYNTKNINIVQTLLSYLTYNDIPYPMGIFRNIDCLDYNFLYNKVNVKSNNKLTLGKIFKNM